MTNWQYNPNRYHWIESMPLSERVYWIIRFRYYMNEYFQATVTPSIPNMDDIVTFCLRKPDFSKRFWNKAVFHHFMREMHKEELLLQVIRNCQVDTSNPDKYKWYFYRPSRIVKTRSSLLNDNTSKNQIEDYLYVTNKGIKVRSAQELHIYEKLSTIPGIEVEYEKKFKYKSEYKLPDFTFVINDKTYFWEHFGMSEDWGYFYNMANKIEWYYNAGLKPFKDGGCLIFTIFEDALHFHRKVDEIICDINELI